MQYILTQSEYDTLTPVKLLQERNEALEVARGLILDLSGHTCIHQKIGADRNRNGGYCDNCPLAFHAIGHENSSHICILAKNYSK